MLQRILVLGGGSAGFLSAITLKSRLPHADVVVLHSSQIPIIGVGEGSTVVLPMHLHGYLGIPLDEFFREAAPIWKLGIRFVWGPKPYFDYTFARQIDLQYAALPRSTGFYADDRDPDPGRFDPIGIQSGLMSLNKVFLRRPDGRLSASSDVAYHVENEQFVACLEKVARRVGIRQIDDAVAEVRVGEAGVTGLKLASGAVATADLYIDCSGFSSMLLGKAMGEPFIDYSSTLFCDRAVVGGWQRTDEPIQPYTVAETMDAGWAWRIDHEHRINRGYVYSSAFISDEQAEQEFRRKNPNVRSTRIVRFSSGRYRNPWVKNVVAIGNASGFVEPMEATALSMICSAAQWLAETIHDCEGNLCPSLTRQYNRLIGASWDSIRRFLAVHYKFNTRLDTEFWRACREKLDLAGAEDVVEYYRENGPSVAWRPTLLEPDDQFGLEGYWSILVGQRVPYRKIHHHSDAERAAWARIRQAIARQAQSAIGVDEALRLLRHPEWRWPDLYKGRQLLAAPAVLT